MISSRVINNFDYSSETNKESDSDWIQPSITREIIELGSSGLINGIYVRIPSEKNIVIIDSKLAQEIDAWESASDFDFWSIEDSLED